MDDVEALGAVQNLLDVWNYFSCLLPLYLPLLTGSDVVHPSPRSSLAAICARAAVSQRFTQRAQQVQLVLRKMQMFRASRNNRTGINNRAVASLDCGENDGFVHEQVSERRSRERDGKKKAMVISCLFTNPDALPLHTKIFHVAM